MDSLIQTRTAETERSATDREAGIPGLTGLRFVASFSVVLAHCAGISLRMLDPPPAFEAVKYWMETAAGFGMTLFFVLSGFVIHYNYQAVISGQGLPGILSFLWARFCRLYPLFALIVALDLLLGGEFSSSAMLDQGAGLGHALLALSFFLTFVQSWFYAVIGSSSLIYAVGAAIPVSWSISTEWFFYLMYPLVMLALVRTKSARYATASAIIFSVIWAVLLSNLQTHSNTIQAWGISQFGIIASSDFGNQNGFIRWLLYFSPYVRIGEFILGCMTAQLYIVLRNYPITAWERRFVFLLLIGACISVPAISYLMYDEGGTTWIRRLNDNFGLAPSIAVILFCTARYRWAILRPLESRIMVRLGDASYSIYLTHLLIFSLVMHAAPAALPDTVGSIVFLFLRVASMLFSVLVISDFLYLYFENPARRMLRRLWNRPGRLIRPSTVALAPCLLAVVFFSTGYALAGNEEIKNGIYVDVASYGQNCGIAMGNVTSDAGAMCNGREICNYVVQVSRLGDPSPGCGKNFSLEYYCAPHRFPRVAVRVPGEAGFGSVVHLQCPIK